MAEIHRALDAGYSKSAAARLLRCSEPNIIQRLRKEAEAKEIATCSPELAATPSVHPDPGSVIRSPLAAAQAGDPVNSEGRG